MSSIYHLSVILKYPSVSPKPMSDKDEPKTVMWMVTYFTLVFSVVTALIGGYLLYLDFNLLILLAVGSLFIMFFCFWFGTWQMVRSLRLT